MKKRILCLCMVVAALLSACGTRKTPFPEPAPQKGVYSEEKPLMATVASEAEAKELAELYGITLVEFNIGIATFYTEEDLMVVIQRGQENGWTPLEINYIQQSN